MIKRTLFRATDGRNYLGIFILVSSLFLLWGCCNGLIDVLNKHFQDSLHISKAKSAYVQLSNYMAYFLMALPASMFARRYGYKAGMVMGLLFVATGAFGFIPATRIGSYAAFLSAVFILATGLSFLETTANPYTTLLGAPEDGSARINLAQFCGGIGWMIGPLIGGHFILSATGVADQTNSTLYRPYLYIGMVVAVLAVIFWLARIPDLQAHDEYQTSEATSPPSGLLAHPHFVWSILAQFAYVAAQTGIFSFFINYIINDTPAIPGRIAPLAPRTWIFADASLWRITDRGASQLLAFGGFGLLLLGRLLGGILMHRIRPHFLLACFGVAGAISMLLVILPLGWVSVAALFLSFFFMSLMFPTIFALGIHGIGELTKRASSFLIMSIVGGAVMPILMGWLADRYSMRIGFAMPLGCFVVIAAYAAAWPWLKRAGRRPTPARPA